MAHGELLCVIACVRCTWPHGMIWTFEAFSARQTSKNSPAFDPWMCIAFHCRKQVRYISETKPPFVDPSRMVLRVCTQYNMVRTVPCGAYTGGWSARPFWQSGSSTCKSSRFGFLFSFTWLTDWLTTDWLPSVGNTQAAQGTTTAWLWYINLVSRMVYHSLLSQNVTSSLSLSFSLKRGWVASI